MSEIDWNVMLRRIEREYDGLPPETVPAGVRAQRAAALRAREEQRAAGFGAWLRMLLVAALAASLYWWPNAHECDLHLAAFLGAESMVAIGGLWIAWFTWRHRLALSHAVALTVFMAGLVLVAAQTLPRLGYATIAGIHADGWRCAGGATGRPASDAPRPAPG
jgi:hypothetical protein